MILILDKCNKTAIMNKSISIGKQNSRQKIPLKNIIHNFTNII